MAGRDSAKYSSNAKVRRCGVVVGGALGLFVAAAAMATGSAAPAKADFEDLLDPIIQPLLTSVTDSLSSVDPTLATDLTSWTDSLLASLNSANVALSAASAGAVPAADPPTEADSPSDTYTIPITIQEDTEPTVNATIDGGSDQTLLVDTGSSGLVIPWDYLGSNDFTSLEDLFQLGFPTSIGESGYSGGVQYIYLEYGDATVDYGGVLTTTSTPIDVEVFSWSDSTVAGTPANFEQFLQDDDSTGILGIGDSASDGGPTVSPLEADGYDGVLVDIPNVPDDTLASPSELDGDLIVTPTNPDTPIATLPGAPITDVWESINGGPLVAVSDDVDSGGVYGTIPSSLSVSPGDTVSVYDNSLGTGGLLYSYTAGTDTDGTSEVPTSVSGTDIDSGIEAFIGNPIYIDYGNDTIAFDE
jgi:hypothetical protein